MGMTNCFLRRYLCQKQRYADPDGKENPMTHEVQNMDATQKLVADKVREGDCILFLGAGVHRPPQESSGYVYPEEQRPCTTEELAKNLADECQYGMKFPEESCPKLERVSLYFQEELGRDELVNSLNRYLKDGKKPSEALMMLARLPFKIFVTTNYDLLLDDALAECKKKAHRIVYNPSPDVPTCDLRQDPTAQEPLVFKMHGDLEQRDSIVITDEDYITFVQRMSDKDPFHPVPQTVRYRMQRWPILFVGYSLGDYNLRLIFRTLRWHIDVANFPRAYAVDIHPDPLILRVWQDERKFITFVTQDLWTFVPRLLEKVETGTGKGSEL
jgi:hypothetical protein